MQIIYLDISNKGVVPTVYAKQGDVGRKFEVVLTDFGIPYYPPNGSAFSVWYSGSSGDGNYTDIGDKSAFFVSENKITVEMIAQMFSAYGAGILCLTLNSPDGNQISSWNIPYICEPVPGIDSEEAKSYYTAFSNAVKDLPYPDASLSAPGKAADAAATGLALAGKAPAVESAEYPGCYYRTVNGAVEWLNPPMISGVEYRTTERWNGKAVWTALIDCGTVVAGENTISTNFACSGVIGARGYAGSEVLSTTYESERHDKYASILNAKKASGKVAITIIRGTATSASSPVHVQAWYTKD